MLKRLAAAALTGAALTTVLTLATPAAAHADTGIAPQERGALVALLLALGFDVEVVEVELDTQVDAKVETDVETGVEADVDAEATVKAGTGA